MPPPPRAASSAVVRGCSTRPMERDSVRAVLAFLKRRWFLLSCAVVLLGSSMLDIRRSGSGQTSQWYYGMRSGDMFFDCYPASSEAFVWYLGKKMRVHGPAFGHSPAMRFTDNTWISIPLWLLLSSVVAWII